MLLYNVKLPRGALSTPFMFNRHDLTAFSVPIDLTELTQTEGAEDVQTWIWSRADCFQFKADRGANAQGKTAVLACREVGITEQC